MRCRGCSCAIPRICCARSNTSTSPSVSRLHEPTGRIKVTERTVLMIAFQFPPMRGSSAIQRTLRFAQHLPKFGWRPIVLTASPGAYETVSTAAESDTGPMEVLRARALDAAKHLSILGRYPRWLAVPDRWSSWKFSAIPAARRLIRERPVDLIWSTFPIATAHQIGHSIARRTGIPWIAEFRDPMWQGAAYPPHPRVTAIWRRLEGKVFEHARRIVVTTLGAAQDYQCVIRISVTTIFVPWKTASTKARSPMPNRGSGRVTALWTRQAAQAAA